MIMATWSLSSIFAMFKNWSKIKKKLICSFSCRWAKRLWRTKLKPWCQRNCSCCKCFQQKGTIKPQTQVEKKIEDYMERERNKPELGDFTLTEYTEKVLVYGFLMVRVCFEKSINHINSIIHYNQRSVHSFRLSTY